MGLLSFTKVSIGKKLIVGITGLFLCSFLVAHLSINSLILLNDGGESFNQGAHFMATNPMIRIMEVGLIAGLLLHIIYTLVLTLQNRAKRPVAYAKTNANANSKWYSRSMAILGSLLLVFLVVHMGDFWIKSKEVQLITHENHSAFEMVKHSLTNPIFFIIYLIGFASLGFHLLHGFQSGFQTLGLNHKKYTPLIKGLGSLFAVIVPLMFAIIASSIFFGFIK